MEVIPRPMQPSIEYLDADQAAGLLGEQARALAVTEFARVRNLGYVFAPFELYPLAPRVQPPLAWIAAFAVDMDGTSTTTEPLALHALEYMVRRFTGLDPDRWPGLDPQRDYPYVIGNSNFRHTELLIERYGDRIDPVALRQAFFEAVLWTLASMPDPQRRREVSENARHCGLAGLLEDGEFRRLAESGPIEAGQVGSAVAPFVSRFGGAFSYRHRGELVSAALDIYYMRYHSILQRIEGGEGDRLSRELLGARGRQLIEPMPGYAAFVALLKGWLGAEADGVFELLRTACLADPGLGHDAAQLDQYRPRLVTLGAHFEREPARLALVTASIAYEAQAVMKEVVRVLARKVQDWPVCAARRNLLAEKLSDPGAVFDAFVNASDAHEARLKPHRDLYSIALFRMSIPKSEYCYCVGLEDTEPGIVALRAAGVGCALALPNRDTHRQNYAAAAQVIRGGLPEVILAHNMLLRELP